MADHAGSPVTPIGAVGGPPAAAAGAAGPYEPPAVLPLGRLSDLTHGASGADIDGAMPAGSFPL